MSNHSNVSNGSPSTRLDPYQLSPMPSSTATTSNNSAASSSGGLANFSPISTLARQYQNHPSATSVGRILIAVHCNHACCVTLDELWKARKQKPHQLDQPTLVLGEDTTSSSTCTGGAAAEAAAEPFENSNANAAPENPFSFLERNEPSTVKETTAPSLDASNKRKPNFGRFLKKVASSGTQALERGMHQLAIKADQGKSPDRLVVGVYETQTDMLLHATEAQPLPVVRSNGIQFRIPLAIPATTTGTITIKLWIRSGAALAASKHYPVAESGPLDTTKLRASLAHQAQQQQANIPVPALFFPVTLLPNAVIVDGKLHCTAISDNKFPISCGKGWSLQDPNPASAYSVAAAGMFHLPLDQSYCFAIPNRPTPPPVTTLLATERSVESAVVLPLATAWARLASTAAQISLEHVKSVGQTVLYHRHDAPTGPEYANVNMRLSHFQTNHASSQLLQNAKGSPTVTISFQRPSSIFEVELLPPTKLPLHPHAAGGLHGTESAVRCQFYPKPVRDGILPAIAQQIPGRCLPQHGTQQFLLGNVRLLVALPRGRSLSSDNIIVPVNPFDAPGISTNSAAPSKDEGSGGAGDVWDCIIPLDVTLADASKNGRTQEVPILDIVTGQVMGTMVFTMSVQMIQQTDQCIANVPATGGLVDLVGLPHLTDGVLPALDYWDNNSVNTAPELQRRRSQLATMGNFVMHDYLDHHLQNIRQADAALLEDRVGQYQRSLDAALGRAPPPEHVPSHQDRTPRAFRPSASRSTVLLSGIGFNVHTASIALDVLDAAAATAASSSKPNHGMATQPPPGAVFHNITCGAPADHARGFGDVFAAPKEKSTGQYSGAMNSPIGPATGGLRRLEATRRALAAHVSNEQTALVMLIQNYFVEQRQQQYRGRPVTHVPPRHAELIGLRWKVFEAVQCLHHLTWACTMRRASVFSQALGIAVSSYLSSISDMRSLQSTWPEYWTRHGYLVSFEGLLSAAGKELGMIEDASVAISMLQNVRVILVPDDCASNLNRVPVPHSLYLRWVHMWSVQPDPGAKERAGTEYILQIGIVPSYFDQRIPTSLKNGAPVRFFPLLFEVGVDIFQAASNVGSNMSKTYSSGGCTVPVPEIELPKPRLTEDEEDDTGVADDDVLVQLNYEAFQKMNYYAQSVSPAAPVQATSTHQTHPLLATLFQHIVSSSGKMNHDILDEAAHLAQQLGGGGCVFCKSGKDRTAMHVTYKQAQFETRFRAKLAGNATVANTGSDEDADSMMQDTTLDDAMLMRLYGTRLPICEKNVGQAKYAFNSLQVKFMPDALKPPMSALAGFLKGGKVFGKGGIET